jgi:glutathione synthase/RimK-type ligase-like ATP-grasp enzyme
MRKTEALLTDPEVAPYIPQTKALGEGNLRDMLGAHGFVVVKPIVGGGGHGVIKVTRSGSQYSITDSFKTSHYTSFTNMYSALQRVKVKRKYLIQQGIHLARINGRPIDYRVKHVKSGGHWEIRAMVGRLARHGLFVTNLCKGGTLLKGREGLRKSLPHISSAAKSREMRRLTRKCTSILESHFPGIGQLGFDYGLDTNGKIWIFEVNTRPQ